MWPFTSRRIMGNRWWAIAFVIFVCYQAIDFIGAAPAADNTDNATITDISGAPVDNDQLHNAEEALKSL
ncbi:hypothetical protein D3Y57_11680 [Sphingomonas paeninsulae]|jgi:hypothetical protein|uniref:Uncharacterized protein n=1 Tax=Sphingomonas paeninsulae TaxID=2319844 RepID=A0A494TBK3_SPHPE|nr:hypothetical protein [Sphingomonas paeninsulae]AYJ86510.1 hypothetical protein D3Y57_11680 [Sphingomonas paeninsulae]